ncbi:hypothetical protein E4U09_006749 [Claviceps aff. purpurea]|uniref:Uncharacterized protein n=1 Tax=Claviceps aff. purpurea TaxID=1967640 RepID=A0A9P7QAQ6_9HYPO|nr:hypothetical protein E4U09_006749 [Claviceps aff. purpurea]
MNFAYNLFTHNVLNMRSRSTLQRNLAEYGALETFYTKTDAAIPSQHQTAITMFDFEDGMTIDAAWRTLKDHQRKFAGADATLKPGRDCPATFLIFSSTTCNLIWRNHISWLSRAKA